MYMTRTKLLKERICTTSDFGRGQRQQVLLPASFSFRTNFHAISSLFPMISTASQGKFVFSILHHQFNILIQKKKKKKRSCCPKTKTNSKCYIYNKFFFS